jgi:hypothetical protein
MPTSTTKPRADAWDATLTDAQRWQAFDQFRRGKWYEVADWARDQFGLAQSPGRASLYRWAGRMRKLESAHRIEQAIQARDEIGALAGTAATSGRLIEAYQSLAAELALKGNAPDAVRLTTMAMQIAAQQQAAAELEIKKQRLGQQQDALRLAREKFEAAEAKIAAVREAVGKARASGGLTPETLKKIEEAAGLL